MKNECLLLMYFKGKNFILKLVEKREKLAVLNLQEDFLTKFSLQIRTAGHTRCIKRNLLQKSGVILLQL